MRLQIGYALCNEIVFVCGKQKTKTKQLSHQRQEEKWYTLELDEEVKIELLKDKISKKNKKVKLLDGQTLDKTPQIKLKLCYKFSRVNQQKLVVVVVMVVVVVVCVCVFYFNFIYHGLVAAATVEVI